MSRSSLLGRDALQVVGLDARTGKIAWQFTASGRVDTSPTLHKGLCLFDAQERLGLLPEG